MTEQQEKLQKLVTEMYQQCGVEVEPLFPKILVRVLPKETQTKSGLFLPGGKDQSKPAYEGVVLKTYKPFFQKVYLDDIGWRKDDWNKEATYFQKVESALKPGDHILFPHIEYGITPVTPLDNAVGDYRLVPEQHVMAKLEYEQLPVKAWLADWLDMNIAEFEDPYDLSEEILKNADVIRKDTQPLTVSGN